METFLRSKSKTTEIKGLWEWYGPLYISRLDNLEKCIISNFCSFIMIIFSVVGWYMCITHLNYFLILSICYLQNLYLCFLFFNLFSIPFIPTLFSFAPSFIPIHIWKRSPCLYNFLEMYHLLRQLGIIKCPSEIEWQNQLLHLSPKDY